MPRIIMSRAFTARWTRMPHSTGRLSASVSSHHSLSSASSIYGGSWLCIRHITIRRARTWVCGRMRRYGEVSKDQEPSLPHQFCSDCIITTGGYDFRKGQGELVFWVRSREIGKGWLQLWAPRYAGYSSFWL